MVFVNDKDPRNFFIKATNPWNLLHFLLTSIDGETNSMMHVLSSYMSGRR